ncbi:MAG: hypothetical protein ABFC57_12900 [Veillonellales bacterium]
MRAAAWGDEEKGTITMASYYSDEAYQLSQWAREENNRIKASHLMRVATKLENTFCKHHSSYCSSINRIIEPPCPPPYGSRPVRTK